MATTKLTIDGPVSWAKVFEQNRDMEGYQGAAKEYGGQYSINIYLDENNIERLNAVGSQKKAKKPGEKSYTELDNSNGMLMYSFTRRHQDRYEWASGAPRVVKADGTPWDFGEDGLIGNGSVCRIQLACYDTARGVGTRLEAIKVLDLVPYASSNPDDPGLDDFDAPVKGATTSKPAPKAKAKTDVVEDDIPF